ncbi:MAG: hypothetical protein RLZ98_2578 [Pseudomonadota bacterium]|jgi:arylformamidase
MTSQQLPEKWRRYSAAEFERQFNPRAANPDVEAYGRARDAINAEGLAWPGRIADVAYGAHPLMTLDIYPPAAGAHWPVQIYIHGGYWRSRDKSEFAFIGAAFAKAGMLGVVVNYPLCPEVSLDAVVAGTLDGFGWICSNISNFGGDAGRIFVVGHSAGAHLGAAILACDWDARDLSSSPVAGAVLVSGIYDPSPAVYTTVNTDLELLPDIIARHDYSSLPPRIRCPVHVIVGGGEPEEWIGQSATYARHLTNAGVPVRYTVSGKENHFSLLDQYRDQSSDTFRAILEQH